jgi:uncharacterized membrane protein
MNLDLLPLGWVHFIASLIAVGVGAATLVRPKGTPTHRLQGRIYAAAVLVSVSIVSECSSSRIGLALRC